MFGSNLNEEGNLVVSGLVAKPGQSRPTRKGIDFFCESATGGQ